jgi:hypothetical protein
MLPYAYKIIRAAAILTTSYVAGTVWGPSDTSGDRPHEMNQLIVYIDFTIGSLTDAQVKVEFSHDGTTYYQETFSSISTTTSTESLGVHKFTATGKYRLAIPIKDNYIKISAIGTGTTTSSSMAINAVIGGV